MEDVLSAAVDRRLRGTAQADVITPRAADGGAAPLSLAQERLWFLHQLDPDSAAYNVPVAYRLRGPLDLPCLLGALYETVRRHELLRSTIDDDEAGRPRQRVEPPGSFELMITAVDGDSVDERLARARVLAQQHVRAPFDLRKGPLMRAELFKIGPDDHVLLLCLHHVIADHWTLAVLLNELSELYMANLLERPSSLAEPPIQFADYAVWEHERLRTGHLDAQLRHWRERLAGLEPLDLHPDRPRPATQRWRGSRVRRRVHAEVVADLRRLAAEHDVTLFVVVAAGLSALLGRYTGQSDVAIGAAIANRSRPELEGLVGFFVNTVVLRTDLSGDPTFADLLAGMRETALQAQENQDLPLERLVESLGPDRDLSRPPLVNVVLSFLNTPGDGGRMPGTTAAEFEFDPGVVKFELDVFVREDGGELVVDVDYRTDLFERATIERMLGHFERLLAGAAATPASRVADLAVLSPAETAQLLAWGNASGPAAPTPPTVPELFAEQVARRPDAPALRHGDEVLSYRELASRAGRLADLLRAYGRPVCVGVCLDRSVEMVVTLLAVLEAGGHYLPLDPTYPADRLRFMLTDAGAQVLVTTGALAGRIPGWSGPALLVEDLPAGNAAPVGTPAVGPDDLAYVMYTSGSTGRPKGIRVPHRGVVRLVHDTDYARIGAGDRVAHASSISFDAATLEIWGALLTGAELVVLPQETVVEPRALAASLREHGITVLWMTSSLFNHTVRDVPDAVACVGTVIVGGEALDVPTIRAVLRDGAPGRLLNGYGPTENTTFTTTHTITELPDDTASVPIGRPIRGTRCYVVDERLTLVPAGVPGELCVAGLGLAQGYVGRPELTAQRFVPDPFGAPGELLYRTGDVVRWRGDGVLEFLGRRDDQVKVRGYRIELGEIEAQLKARPDVRAAVVLVRADDDGPALVGYVVPADPAAPMSISDLQAELAAALPSYMIPSGFVVLERFPLNANGKVDRARLAELAAQPVGTDFVEPRTELETAVSREWARLLGVDRVGRTDNFFHLGGNSLLATRAVSRLRRDLGVPLTVRTLFDHPTVEAFASRLHEIGERRT